VMIFGDTGKDVVIKVDGSSTENVRSFKYLGIISDPDLNFSLQVDNAVCKAKQASLKVSSLTDG